jgi:hypothetical protein
MIFKLPRKRWVVLAVLGAALAVAVPVAWATFSDVGPEDPFYADVNAIQGAGITSGCGGGNFCPTASITREAEAAFVHRAGARTGFDLSDIVSVSGTPVDVDVVTIHVGGVAGGTQFVKLDGNGVSYITSTTGCPCQTRFWISQDGTLGRSQYVYTANTFVGSSGYGFDSASASAVLPVPTASTQTFRLQAVTWDGSGDVSAFGGLTAITAPFGSTGADTQNATLPSLPAGSPVAHRK